MNDLKTYLSLSTGSTLTFEEASQILDAINECYGKISAEDKEDYYKDMLEKAFKYSGIRCEWELMTGEERSEKDPYRTSVHNGFIISLNVLARLAELEGIDASWLGKLGENRKRIGDFACFLTYINGICNR
jgi:hypothetical protein